MTIHVFLEATILVISNQEQQCQILKRRKNKQKNIKKRAKYLLDWTSRYVFQSPKFWPKFNPYLLSEDLLTR